MNEQMHLFSDSGQLSSKNICLRFLLAKQKRKHLRFFRIVSKI